MNAETDAVSKLRRLIATISLGGNGLNQDMNMAYAIRSFWIRVCMIF
jgi:hypothetical protein